MTVSDLGQSGKTTIVDSSRVCLHRRHGRGQRLRSSRSALGCGSKRHRDPPATAPERGADNATHPPAGLPFLAVFLVAYRTCCGSPTAHRSVNGEGFRSPWPALDSHMPTKERRVPDRRDMRRADEELRSSVLLFSIRRIRPSPSSKLGAHKGCRRSSAWAGSGVMLRASPGWPRYAGSLLIVRLATRSEVRT
jgi:hypothetical protein